MATPFLPLELITEILTKLPVKSLHRFKCVSKTWNSIITSPKFIKQHLHQTLISNTNNKIIIIISKNSILSSAISTVKLRFDIVKQPLNNLPHIPPVDIIESVHGLLLLVDSSKETVCLFNPSNKTRRSVPRAPSRKPAFGFRLVEVFGFGYDSVTDDYKVVRLAQWELFGFFDREASVYSMRNDSWESVNDETVLYALKETCAIAVDSTLWFVTISSNSDSVLKGFDLRTNRFSLVDFPEFDSDSGKMMNLRSLRGCLCLIVSYRKYRDDPDNKFTGNPFYNHEFLFADVWEMNESKWVKLFKIRKNEIHKHCMYLRLVTYSKDMKSVLIEVDCNWHGWYDLVTKKFKRVPVQGLEAVDAPYVAYPYVETLVSVVNNKVVSKKEGTRLKKTIKKNDFLSSGFKLKL